MHNVFIILRREYLERVRTKSFWVTTILVPTLMSGVIILPSLMMRNQKGQAKHIAVLANNPEFGEGIQRSLRRAAKDSPAVDTYTIDVVTPGSPAQAEEQRKRVESGDLDGMLLATDDAIASRKLTYSSRTNA